ncbi:MAG TPA: glycosyltransferase family 39 protein, partial [Pyrinomonadaceae bacterium]|jgi:4-amino-4-deoxy-L-arabinose transferase-like glycosyltransferase
MNSSHLKLLLVLAVLFTLLNSVKPVCLDDALYYARARQVAEHPLDPYGFEVFWNDRPEPAIGVLAPPLFPYYWAAAIRLFGERPFLWKLWLLPLSLLLVFSLYALFRRFAPGHELLLTWMTVLSPTFLPSFNLMLEIPVSALSFSALVLFFRAHDRDSLVQSALAGLVAGIAMQTKYTAFILPPLMLLYAIIFKRIRLGLLAASLAVAVFWTIEGLFAISAHHSHLLYQSGIYGSVNLAKKYLYLAWPLVTTFGGVAPFLALLGLVALRASRRMIIAAACLVALGYLLIALVPARLATFTRDQRTYQESITLAWVVFSIFGVAVFAALLEVIRRLLGWSKAVSFRLVQWREFGVELFLVLWLCAEVAAYFALSPIPAVRRVFGVLLVSTLLIGRLASKTCEQLECRALMRRVAAGSMALAMLFYAVDLHDAWVEKVAAEGAARRVQETDAKVTAWYVGRWGFQYYAERAGLKPVVADQSEFRTGDWLIVSDGPYYPKPVEEHINRYRIEPFTSLTLEDSLPLATMIGYYNSGIPIHHHEGPHRTVRIYRIAGKMR